MRKSFTVSGVLAILSSKTNCMTLYPSSCARSSRRATISLIISLLSYSLLLCHAQNIRGKGFHEDYILGILQEGIRFGIVQGEYPFPSLPQAVALSAAAATMASGKPAKSCIVNYHLKSIGSAGHCRQIWGEVDELFVDFAKTLLLFFG